MIKIMATAYYHGLECFLLKNFNQVWA